MNAGIDTVKLSFGLGSGGLWTDNVHAVHDADGRRSYSCGEFTSRQFQAGAKGPVRYRHWTHPDLYGGLTIKGVPGSSVVALWEGSVSKALGVCGPASPDCVRFLEDHVRKLIERNSCMRMVSRAAVRRCDVTSDHVDPDGLLRLAARGWNPHKRSRYWEDVIQGGETVWQHNKSRGVRVYDKFAECGEPWAEGLTRIEYQIGSDWCQKYGLGRVDDIERNYRSVIEPLVRDLKGRAAL